MYPEQESSYRTSSTNGPKVDLGGLGRISDYPASASSAASVERPQSEVERELGQLGSTLDNLIEALYQLDKRLEPVMISTPENDAKTGAEPANMSPLARLLKEKVNSAEAALRMVRRMNNRLTL